MQFTVDCELIPLNRIRLTETAFNYTGGVFGGCVHKMSKADNMKIHYILRDSVAVTF